MGVINTMKKMGKTGVMAAALAELQQEAVKEATKALKDLYAREKKAKKILRGIEREIEDYLLELELDDDDANGNGDAKS